MEPTDIGIHIQNIVMQFVCRREIFNFILVNLFVCPTIWITYISNVLFERRRQKKHEHIYYALDLFSLLLSVWCCATIQFRHVACTMNETALWSKNKMRTPNDEWKMIHTHTHTLTKHFEDNRRHPCTTL